jgi:hypothetical protein
VQRDRLDPQDALTPRKWQYYTYLIAVSYELEGQDEAAVEIFLSVMQAEPHTIWGNFAAMHLKAKP